MTITVEYMDGTSEVFSETSRPGGSYHTSGKAELGWYIITDAWGSKTNIPAERIKKVTTNESRH
jgi:hypothetical protein